MGFRVTTEMLLRSALANIDAQRARLARTQEQAASGLRINRPSDDPVGARLAVQLRGANALATQFERNIEQGQSRLRTVEVAVSESIDVIERARELAIQGANDTLDANGRIALSQEIEQLHDELLSRANTRYAGGYVFAGRANDSAAFAVSGPFVDGAAAPTVTYLGDGAEIEVEIESGVRVPSTIDGRRVFLGDADGDGAADAGREDLFDVLAELWGDLQADDVDGVRGALDRLERAQFQLSLEQIRVGSFDGRMSGAREIQAETRLAQTTRLSEVEDADSVEVFSSLVVQENALRASLDAASRVVQPSLMDFLR